MSTAVAEQTVKEPNLRAVRSRRGRPRKSHTSGPQRTKVQLDFTEEQLARVYKLRQILQKKTHGEVIGYSLALAEWLHEAFLDRGYELYAIKDDERQKLAFLVS